METGESITDLTFQALVEPIIADEEAAAQAAFVPMPRQVPPEFTQGFVPNRWSDDSDASNQA